MLSYMITGIVEQFKDLYESKLFDLTLATGVAAYFGAWGAQKLAEREKRREEIVREIRNTNAAIAISMALFNQFVSMKRQHVKRLYQDYLRHRAEFDKAMEKPRSERPVTTFAIDMQTLSLEWGPVDILQDKIFSQISAVGRPLNLAAIISVEFHALANALNTRNAIIESNKAKNVAHLPLEYYFGLPDAHGNVNQDWPSLINAIHLHTDCGVFFTQLLCKDLMEHGQQFVTQLKKRYGCHPNRVSKVDFSTVEAGLIPGEDEFRDWIDNFKKHKEEGFLECFKTWLTTLRVV